MQYIIDILLESLITTNAIMMIHIIIFSGTIVNIILFGSGWYFFD
jgi:hypothetical protein